METTKIFSISEPKNVIEAEKLTKLISKEIFAFAEKQGFFTEEGAEFPEVVTKEEQKAGCALWMLGDMLKEIGGRYFFSDNVFPYSGHFTQINAQMPDDDHLWYDIRLKVDDKVILFQYAEPVLFPFVPEWLNRNGEGDFEIKNCGDDKMLSISSNGTYWEFLFDEDSIVLYEENCFSFEAEDVFGFDYDGLKVRNNHVILQIGKGRQVVCRADREGMRDHDEFTKGKFIVDSTNNELKIFSYYPDGSLYDDEIPIKSWKIEEVNLDDGFSKNS